MTDEERREIFDDEVGYHVMLLERQAKDSEESATEEHLSDESREHRLASGNILRHAVAAIRSLMERPGAGPGGEAIEVEDHTVAVPAVGPSEIRVRQGFPRKDDAEVLLDEVDRLRASLAAVTAERDEARVQIEVERRARVDIETEVERRRNLAESQALRVVQAETALAASVRREDVVRWLRFAVANKETDNG